MLTLGKIKRCATTTVYSFTCKVPCTIISNGICQILSHCFNISAPVSSARKGGLFTTLTSRVLSEGRPTLCGRKVVSFNTMRYAPRSPSYLFYPLTRDYSTLSTKEITRLPIGRRGAGAAGHCFGCVCMHTNTCAFVGGQATSSV